MAFDLQFLGGAGTVTGSKTLVRHNGYTLLIDCGLFQGLKALRLRNWAEFPVRAQDINAVILTHAHIDHSGYIPKLVKEGFKGRIYCTPATFDLCRILLPDAGHLQEEEAAYLNKTRRTKHKPALPLFSRAEAIEALDFFTPVDFHDITALSDSVRFEFRYVGHILGAASVILQLSKSTIAFTGDIGRQNHPIFNAPEPLPPCDYLVTESTYGNRPHRSSDVLEQIETVINNTVRRKGVVIIPAFAVGRAQEILYYLSVLRKLNRIPTFPMYLNSPMATNVSRLMTQYKSLHHLNEIECAELGQIVHYIQDPEESKSLNERHGPMLILSASGMCSGGRVLHHLKAFAPHPENTILLAGFQAAGTRGEALENGATEVKIHGDYVPVRAEVRVLDNISAHADTKEIIEWFSYSKISPKKVFITHGEPSAADELRSRLDFMLGWDCVVPELDSRYHLD
jgi:metallo-beta-lactamase family protein